VCSDDNLRVEYRLAEGIHKRPGRSGMERRFRLFNTYEAHGVLPVGELANGDERPQGA
jgi:hypothetical protein